MRIGKHAREEHVGLHRDILAIRVDTRCVARERTPRVKVGPEKAIGLVDIAFETKREEMGRCSGEMRVRMQERSWQNTF